MKLLLNDLQEGKKIYRADPNSITIIEFLIEKGKGKVEDYYQNGSAVYFHQKSVNRSNSPQYYVDYNRIKCWKYTKDDKYFDDLNFKDEVENKVILKDMLKFLNEHGKDVKEENKKKLLWILNELERNIRNHSDEENSSMTMSYTANYFFETDNKRYIQFNISDYGLGFEGRRNVNRSYSILSMKGLADTGHYVLSALEKGVTTKTNASYVTNEQNMNSGYGLFLLNSICKENGNSLNILSDGKLFQIEPYNSSAKFSGEYKFVDGITSIGAKLDISTLDAVFERLEEEESFFSDKSKFSKSTW